MKEKKALIIGITGQDGSYLAELLLEKGYEVHGILRDFQKKRFLESKEAVLYECDLINASGLRAVIEKVIPDEIYNLGGVTDVGKSFEDPEYAKKTLELAPIQILELIKQGGLKTRFFQVSSAEIFGDTSVTPQNEETPMSPRNPYGMAKAVAHAAVIEYRTAHGIFAVNGILYNHTSPRQDKNFLVRKITSGVAEILAGKRKKIPFGSLASKRDVGYAPEYVEAMRLMLQEDSPQDFIIATGEVHRVSEYIAEAFRLAGISDWEKYIEVDSTYHRPPEKSELCGNATKAREKLGWTPKIKWHEFIRIMLRADCEAVGAKLPL
jgi:GDPmannose 4,6-dehydratase